MPSDEPSQKGSSNYDDIVRQLHSKTGRHKATREVVVDPKSGEKKVRVRQKRRSSNHKKRGRSTASETIAINRFINIIVAVLVITVLGFSTIWFLRKGRFESSNFSTSLNAQLSEKLPGELTTSNWRVGLNNIRLGTAKYQGAATETVSEAKFRSFETSLPVNEIIRGGKIQLDFLEVEIAELLLRRPQQNYLAQASLGEGAPVWETPLPKTLNLEKFQITNLSARFAGQEERNEENEVMGLSSASLDYNIKDKSFSLRNGTLRVSGWPLMENLDLEGALAEDASTLELKNISTTLASSSIDEAVGYLEAKGSLAWRGVQDSVIEFNSIPSRPILIKTLIPATSSFLNKVRGRVDIPLGEIIIPAQGDYLSPQVSAELKFVELSLRNLGLLENLRRFAGPTASSFFANPQFNTASAELVLSDGLWELQNINLRYLDQETGNEVNIYGDLSWSQRQPPQGQLLFGLNSNFFSSNEREEIRASEEGKVVRGFHWQQRADTLFYTRLNVGGDNLQLLSSEPAKSQLGVFDTQFPNLAPSNSEEQ